LAFRFVYRRNVKSRGVYLGGSIAILLGAGLALNCGGSGHLAGSVGGACLAGGACNSGLTCLSQICVQPADGGGGSAGAAGTGGAGGATLGVACTAATTMTAPSNRLIADFSGPDGGLKIPDGGLENDGGPFPASVVEIGGGLTPYPIGSASAPAYDLSGGALHVTVDTPATSAPQYVGMFLGFADCIDATAFTGVSFTISGSFAGCTMQYATGDVEHSDSTVDTYRGTGPAGSYDPQTTLTAGDVTAAPQTLMMPFPNSTISGSPPTPVDKTKLIALIWQFTVPAAASSTADAAPAACVADITIDNVSFY
jgi:hypothetical protein